MPKIKKPKPSKPYRLLIAIAVLAAMLPALVFAAAVECKTLASGVFTSTQNTSFVGIPVYARNVFFITDVTAVSGTTPSMTVQYAMSDTTTALNAGGNTATTGAITATTKRSDLWKDAVSGFPLPVLGYQRAQLTISGTSPSFTASFKVCFDSR